jgi:hypothetical protein
VSVSHWVDIHVPGLPPERRVLEADQVWVVERGRGALRARSEITGVPPDVALVPGEHGVLVKRRPDAAVRMRVHGSEVPEALVPWGDEVFLDDVRLSFLCRKDGSKARPLVLLLALLVASGAVLAAKRARPSESARGTEAIPPPLFVSGAGCSVDGTKSAEARAIDAERTAVAKRERYVFDASDGVAALRLLDEAAGCFREAGRIEDARRATAELEEWQRKLDADYASLRLEVRAALSEKRTQRALRAARDLEDLLSTQPDHPYAEWLRSVRRDLERNGNKPKKR